MPAVRSAAMSTNGLRTLPGVIEWWAREHDERVAHVVPGGDVLTYGEWRRRAARAARGLTSENVSPRDCVALAFDRGSVVDFAVAFFAVQLRGAIALSLPDTSAASQLEAVVAKYEPTMVVTSAASRVFADVELSGTRHLKVADLEGIGAELAGAADAFTAVEPEDVASVVMTSGTTGVPKGVAITHVDHTFHHEWYWPPIVEDRELGALLHSSPLSAVDGQWAMLVPLLRGLRTITLPQFSPRAFFDAVETYEVTEALLVPTMAVALARSSRKRHDTSSLRKITLGAAPCPLSVMERLAELFPHATITVDYSTSESGAAGTSIDYGGGDLMNNVGRPYYGTRVRIVDERRQPVAIGEKGEVELQPGSGPLRSYFRDPAATAQVFADGWLRTADLGFVDSDGCLHLAGRRTDVVNSGGTKISCWEVERALEQHQAVVEAAAVGVPHPILGEELIAVVVTTGAVEVAELDAFAAARLDADQRPQSIVLVDSELPRTASGKVRKEVLAQRLSSDPRVPEDRGSATGAGREMDPASTTEAVRQIVCETLLRSEVSPDDDLLGLAASSLDLIRVYSAISQRFGVDIGISAVFEVESIRDLANVVAAETDGSGSGNA